MRLPLLFTRTSRWVFGGIALVALAMQLDTPGTAHAGAVMGALALAWVAVDLIRSGVAWYRTPLRWERRLPAALALGAPHTVACALVNEGGDDWWVELAERGGPDLDIRGLPLALYVPGHSRIELHYTIVPRRRGTVAFARAELTLRTLHGSFQWRRRSGASEQLRVYPDFMALVRHDWLAQQRRASEMGIRPARQGVDDEAGRCVLFLLDASRRMRDRLDEALDALVLLSHVALADGASVGVLTFGTTPSAARRLAPRAGMATLDALMASLHDLQPHAVDADYRVAATELMRLQPRPALVVLLTRVDGAPSGDLDAALRLLRSRHRVLLAPVAHASLGADLVNRYRAAA